LRAAFYPFDKLAIGEVVHISGDTAHHLNVVRIKSNEAILLLNGKGSRLTGKVLSIQKNLVEIQATDYQEVQPSHDLSLAIANPKKDAFEDILKAAVELGIKNIYPLSSDFSQYDYIPSERVERILESALIQSNNAFMPVVHSQTSLKEFLAKHTDTIVFFNSRLTRGPNNDSAAQQKKTILIGPEGGFSPAEVEIISQYSLIQEIHLPTPILRAPTAVASSVGYLLALRNNDN
jgi:16S rRNA (uracil1498-N3)-methyltransferase